MLERETDARRAVGHLAYEVALARTNDQATAERARRQAARTALVVFVLCVPGPDDDVTQENYAAVCCAIENFCLAAVAEGLALHWSTGVGTRHPSLRAALGADATWRIVALLSVGFPAALADSRRTPAAAFVRWFKPRT